MIHAFMLNPFPSLFAWSLLAPFLLRVVIGYFFIRSGSAALGKGAADRNETIAAARYKTHPAVATATGIIELLAGILLLIGLFTQIAAAILGLIAAAKIIVISKAGRDNSDLHFLIFTVCVSLILLGAGAFALDLPL
jgi:uncharacterized membrane protein YphA (DoxX/SURF4 family)